MNGWRRLLVWAFILITFNPQKELLPTLKNTHSQLLNEMSYFAYLGIQKPIMQNKLPKHANDLVIFHK